MEAGNHHLPGTSEENHKDDLQDDDMFEDACNSDVIETVDLQTAFKTCEVAIDKFFNNDVAGAIELMTPWRTSLYHSLGIAIFEFIPAMLTFEPNQIQRALAAIKTSLAICNKNRKQFTFVESVGSIVKKPNYATYTDLEAHAELCYAEALLLQAALTVIEGEDLAGLIQGTLKVKTCYNTYYNCLDMKDKKTWETVESKDNFTSGMRLGTATFNLMISMLPPGIIAFLEFFGFSGSKDYGLSELEKGSQSPGMRRVMCDMMLLIYHLVMLPFAGGKGDYVISEKILDKILQEYPKSIWFIAFKARFQFLQGNLVNAIAIYKETSSAEGAIEQFHNLCYWELMWIHALILDYEKAAQYADLLREGSRWSKTTHSYMKSAMLMESACDGNNIDTALVTYLLKEATSFKIKIAGKSLPMEKLILRRCARYHAQKCILVLPGLELICLWNLMHILKKHHLDVLHKMLKIIEQTRVNVASIWKDCLGAYEADNLALIDYIHGNVLAAMGLPRQAIEKFTDALKYKNNIKEDTFIIPYAVCDMAMCYFELENYDKSLELLAEIKKKYSSYSLESRLQFRVHSRMQIVKQFISKS